MFATSSFVSFLLPNNLRVIVGYLGAFLLAELSFTFWNPLLGTVAHSCVLILLLVHVARQWQRAPETYSLTHRFILTLLFVPLVRILSVTLPLAGMPILYRYVLIAAPLFVAALLAKDLLGYTFAEIGLHFRGMYLQLGIGLSGIAFGVAAYPLIRPQPLFDHFSLPDLWPAALVILICTGFVEEFVFRGLVLSTLRENLGQLGTITVNQLVPVLGRKQLVTVLPVGTIVAALAYAVLFVGYRSVVLLLFIFGVALFFSGIVNRTQSIIGVALSHGLLNITLYLFMPFVTFS